jgi:hypothetical protein
MSRRKQQLETDDDAAEYSTAGGSSTGSSRERKAFGGRHAKRKQQHHRRSKRHGEEGILHRERCAKLGSAKEEVIKHTGDPNRKQACQDDGQIYGCVTSKTWQADLSILEMSTRVWRRTKGELKVWLKHSSRHLRSE